jgi:hypothetical protein
MPEGMPIGDSGRETERIDVGKDARGSPDGHEGGRRSIRAQSHRERERNGGMRENGRQAGERTGRQSIMLLLWRPEAPEG